MQEARFWETAPNGRVLCTLCPRQCRLSDGQAGFCAVRVNRGGRLLALAHGTSTGFAADPVEKKPLYHFHPGSRVLSFGTVGCNLACRFCQNWHLSTAAPALGPGLPLLCAEEVVGLAVEAGCDGVAFTYNDPVIWAEWAIDVAREAHRRGLRTVFVTAGYVSERAREEIFPHMDAANIDLKSFSDGFYRKVSRGRLAPVLDTLRWLSGTSVWTEVTNLLIPGLNDGPEETRALAGWLGEHMGPDVPLHLSAFHPAHDMLDVPATPAATLLRARAVAREAGLRHVYTGNIRDSDGQTTRCGGCGAPLIERASFDLRAVRLRSGACPGCGTPLAGRF